MTDRNILISVTDKTGLEKFAALPRDEWRIISTGGTLSALQQHDIPCTSVEEITGFPEMMDGRLKTLHPKIHGGILADRSKPEHLAKAKEHGIPLIDVVVVNLYDFRSKPGIESIDIGGPALIRAAAKNKASVAVVVDSEDYDQVLLQLEDRGTIGTGFREYLALKAFQYTARYDQVIAGWLATERERATLF